MCQADSQINGSTLDVRCSACCCSCCRGHDEAQDRGSDCVAGFPGFRLGILCSGEGRGFTTSTYGARGG